MDTYVPFMLVIAFWLHMICRETTGYRVVIMLPAWSRQQSAPVASHSQAQAGAAEQGCACITNPYVPQPANYDSFRVDRNYKHTFVIQKQEAQNRREQPIFWKKDGTQKHTTAYRPWAYNSASCQGVSLPTGANKLIFPANPSDSSEHHRGYIGNVTMRNPSLYKRNDGFDIDLPLVCIYFKAHINVWVQSLLFHPLVFSQSPAARQAVKGLNGISEQLE